ncbi:unnamed protein product [Cercopithifilaria johnstoni]|uniref:C2HC/C3H-type domain-containing protein n=1 Tax=Cercopithifilaria johnstoni TaxID=2874296 RepID=A0A8J2Q3G3_9BILA|nr:unnamed protein product [Cercopithifilaria johnstoni]
MIKNMLGGTFPRPKTSWREKHETFINAISTSKPTNYTFRSDMPFSSLPKMTVPKDYVKCEYCGRSFNKAAAERHIPFCKTQQEKKGPMKIQKTRSRHDIMIRSEVNNCHHQLSNISLSRDSKMKSKKEECHPVNISSRRSESLQRSHVDNCSGNDRRRERSSSRKASYRASVPRRSSLTRKGT